MTVTTCKHAPDERRRPSRSVGDWLEPSTIHSKLNKVIILKGADDQREGFLKVWARR